MSKVGWIVSAALACACVGAVIYARTQVSAREQAEESLRRRNGDVWLTCNSLQSEELFALWEWTSERHRRGAPPGSDFLGRLLPSGIQLGGLCGADPRYRRQRDYVHLLIYHGQYGQAATRLYQLREDDKSTWDGLDTTTPPDDTAELRVQMALSRRVPNFKLSAWARWHPDDGNDSRAQAFTLLDGADRTWKIAVANRPDLFPIGVEDSATADRVVVALAAIGLRVSPPTPGVPILDWAWSAIDSDLERLGREAEAMDANDDRQEPVASLRQRPYDYRRFRDLLAAVRAEPPHAGTRP